ncbi:hypothetical protein [Serratia sp. C2(1)]|uniref:hypothetical protein n=1 Tax=Serratia sp. C2(1) TaxID=3117679 RepID=UPI002ED20E04|nr:hypothetical protein [Serratia sp. C2(1)]
MSTSFVRRLPIGGLTLLALSLLLSGCEAPRKSAVTPSSSPAAEEGSTPAEREAERMAQCQQELEALKNINSKQHTEYQAEFSRLMSGAAQYAGLRARVNSTAQDTVDALYRYKVTRLCAQVSQAVLNGLADRGEQQK